jgi:hypothetical protein
MTERAGVQGNPVTPAHVLGKLGAASRTEAVARQLGLIS